MYIYHFCFFKTHFCRLLFFRIAEDLKLMESVTKLALHSIFTKFGQWDGLIISQLQAIFQLFSSYPPLGRVLSS